MAVPARQSPEGSDAMYVIVKRSRSRPDYLGFDGDGHHQWTTDRLDAIRFDSPRDGNDCCNQFLNSGAKIVKADEWDGHYETYEDYEVQVFKDDLRGKPGGHRWRYRFGPIAFDRAYTYTPGNLGYTTPTEALKAAKRAVHRVRVSDGKVKTEMR